MPVFAQWYMTCWSSMRTKYHLPSNPDGFIYIVFVMHLYLLYCFFCWCIRVISITLFKIRFYSLLPMETLINVFIEALLLNLFLFTFADAFVLFSSVSHFLCDCCQTCEPRSCLWVNVMHCSRFVDKKARGWLIQKQ